MCTFNFSLLLLLYLAYAYLALQQVLYFLGRVLGYDLVSSPEEREYLWYHVPALVVFTLYTTMVGSFVLELAQRRKLKASRPAPEPSSSSMDDEEFAAPMMIAMQAPVYEV